MIESIKNYLNYELPEIIKYNIDLFLYYIDNTIGILPLAIAIAFALYIVYSLKHKKIQEASFYSQNMFFEDLGGIEDIEEAEEYILSYNREIGANYTAFYEKRGKTFILLNENTKHTEGKVEVPLKINESVRRRDEDVGRYKVYNYISENKQFLLRFYSLKPIYIGRYTGFIEMILQYYETLRKGFDTNVEQQIQEHTKVISEQIHGSFFGQNSFLKFLLSIVSSVSNADGLKIFSDTKEVIIGDVSNKEDIQKLFYIRNTPYKLELYSKEPLTSEQLSNLGNFLELSGTFILTLTEDNEIIENYMKFLEMAVINLERTDPNYINHSKKVSVIAVQVAKGLFLGQDNIKNIELAAIIHDIGMSGDIASLLQGNKELEEEEIDIMKYHPIIGEIIVHPVSSIYPIGAIIKYHHERFDGKGYPYGLKGDDIPLEAQILAFAETFVGIMGDRSYKKGKNFIDTVQDVKEMSGKAFNPVIVNAFIESMDTIRKRLERLDKEAKKQEKETE